MYRDLLTIDGNLGGAKIFFEERVAAIGRLVNERDLFGFGGQAQREFSYLLRSRSGISSIGFVPGGSVVLFVITTAKRPKPCVRK